MTHVVYSLCVCPTLLVGFCISTLSDILAVSLEARRDRRSKMGPETRSKRRREQRRRGYTVKIFDDGKCVVCLDPHVVSLFFVSLLILKRGFFLDPRAT